MELVEVYRCRLFNYDKYFRSMEEAENYKKTKVQEDTESERSWRRSEEGWIDRVNLLKIDGKYFPLPDAVSADEITF